MEFLSYCYGFITASYVLLMLALIFGSFRVRNVSSKAANNTQKFSVIIPFRNEQTDLPALLQSLESLAYPTHKFELLFVDDASEDNSVKIIENSLQDTSLQYQILTNKRVSNSPKKDAIQTAIAQAKYDWIVTTDADCVVPCTWLQAFSQILDTKTISMVVAPIQLAHIETFLHRFQALEILGLQTATKGGFGLSIPFMANAANLAFDKNDFYKVRGYEGNLGVASGDDIFLLEKFVQHKLPVRYLAAQASVVSTLPESSWKAVVNQRIRWASKSKRYRLKRAKLIGMVVFLCNASLLVGIVLTVLSLLTPNMLLAMFVAKIVVDAMSMLVQSRNSEEFQSFWVFPIAAILYPLLSVWVALSSVSGSYRWKDRYFKA